MAKTIQTAGKNKQALLAEVKKNEKWEKKYIEKARYKAFDGAEVT